MMDLRGHLSLFSRKNVRTFGHAGSRAHDFHPPTEQVAFDGGGKVYPSGKSSYVSYVIPMHLLINFTNLIIGQHLAYLSYAWARLRDKLSARQKQ